MKLVAFGVFLGLGILQFWVRGRAFRFLRYTGESRIRASRTLTHLETEHYVPEGARWLGWLRLVTLLWIVSFLVAFTVLVLWAS